MKKTVLLIVLAFITICTQAQTTRISNYNNIGWYTYTGTFTYGRVGLHTEYQWRRTNFITNWQQSLLRTGVNYLVNSKLTVRLGYAWVETYPYGDIPLNSFGKTFTEHRIYEVATLTDTIRKSTLSHRFMLEQRFVGSFSNAALTKEDTWNYMNRFRYMARLQTPLFNNIYAVIYDEVFIGFGKNVRENIFDQNRLSLLVGYNLNRNISIEAGYLSQIVQLGREIDSKNVFQYNNGFIVNFIYRYKQPKRLG